MRVYGSLRSFGQQKTLLAFEIRPITDFNEVGFGCVVQSGTNTICQIQSRSDEAEPRKSNRPCTKHAA